MQSTRPVLQEEELVLLMDVRTRTLLLKLHDTTRSRLHNLDPIDQLDRLATFLRRFCHRVAAGAERDVLKRKIRYPAGSGALWRQHFQSAAISNDFYRYIVDTECFLNVHRIVHRNILGSHIVATDLNDKFVFAIVSRYSLLRQ